MKFLRDDPTFFTAGYGKWPASVRAQQLAKALRGAGVTMLLDIRHSPCASQLDPASNYGPREWHLDVDGRGIVALLRAEGIAYRWIPGLGNPQKNDPEMRILRQQLDDRSAAWPIHDGLALAQTLFVEHSCCLLCACAAYEGCHRRLVAEALRELCGATHRDLTD